MEIIGKFPELPFNFSDSKVLGVFGDIKQISSALSSYFATNIEIEEGFTFYSYNRTLVITFTTNNLSVSSQSYGLLKLCEITNNIIYAPTLDYYETYDKLPRNEYKNFLLEKLNHNTFIEIIPDNTKFIVQNEEFQHQKEFFRSNKYFALISCGKIQIASDKEFQNEYLEFIRKIELRQPIMDEFFIHSEIRQFRDKMLNLGVHANDSSRLAEYVDQQRNFVQDQKKIRTKKLYENIISYLMDSHQINPEISHNLIFKKHFSEAMDEFLKEIMENNEIEIDELKKLFQKKFFAHLENKSKSNKETINAALAQIHNQYKKSIVSDIDDAERTIREKIKDMKKNRKIWKIELDLRKLSLKKKTCEKISTKGFLSNQECYLHQIIVEENIIAIVVRNLHDNVFTIFTSNDRCSFEKFIELDEEPILAKGICGKNIIFVVNDEKYVQKNMIDKITTPYDEINSILSPIYVRKFDCLLFINENNLLFCYNFKKDFCSRIPQVQNKINYIEISECQDFIGVKTYEHVVIYDLKFTVLYKYWIDCEEFCILKKSAQILTFSNEKSSAIIFSSQKVPGEKIEHKKESCFGLDFLYKIQKKEMMHFYPYCDDENLNKILLDYADDLNKLYSKTQVLSFEKTELGTIDKNFIHKVATNNFYKICDLSNNNIIPYRDDMDFYEKMLEQSPDFYNQVKSFINFDYIEKLLEKSNSIKIMSIIGTNCTIKFLSNLFSSVINKKFSPGIWASVSTYKSETYLCLFSIFSGSLPEKLKTLSLFYGISDIFIIDNNLDVKHISDLLEMAKKRLQHSDFFKGRIEIINICQNFHSIESSSLKSKFYSSDFTISNIDKEKQYKFLINEYSNIPSNKKGTETILRLKHTITQLYLDDDYPLDLRLNNLPSEIIFKKQFELKSDMLIVKSFQLNVAYDRKRCRFKCPGCTTMCCRLLDDNGNHSGFHYANFHKVITNDFMFEKVKNNEVNTCDLICDMYSEHKHIQPCNLQFCYTNKKECKHTNRTNKFDLTEIDSVFDISSCKMWWETKKWTI
ncbi:hypothetical protein SteCoe_6379 [Stentor coeruleus]|uniref:Uncharacterized protein n=1 Tax=Stentor coeruleus TaxID=5963 RepID=A0A1R2CQ36_9CILI|nr:hypothetical protein SteCoe_6379 [Stentor coeruleus]